MDLLIKTLVCIVACFLTYQAVMSDTFLEFLFFGLISYVAWTLEESIILKEDKKNNKSFD